MIFNRHRMFHILLSAITLVALIYLALIYTSRGPELIYNADIISVPYLYRDLFHHHGSLAHWMFPPTMCFFPDVVLYFILSGITQNPTLGILLFSAAQYLMLFIFAVKIIKEAGDKNTFPYLASISIFLLILLFLGGFLQQNIFYAFAFGGHFGAALMYLLASWLIIKSFSNQNKWIFRSLFLVCFLTVFSDILFITQFFIPVLITLFILIKLSDEKDKLTLKKNMKIIAISSVISYLFYLTATYTLDIHIMRDSHVIKRWDFLNSSLIIMHRVKMFYQENPLIVWILLTYIFISFSFLIKLIKHYKQAITIPSKELGFNFFMVMLVITIFVGYFSLVFLDNTLVSPDRTLRHFQPFILFPVFIGVPLFLTKYTNLPEIACKYYPAILISILLCAFVFSANSNGSLKALLDYYPSSIACIDQYAKQYHLTNGVAYYWDAKPFTFLSKDNLNIVAIRDRHGKPFPFIWFNTIDDYLKGDFNFAIAKNKSGLYPSGEDLIKNYGKPVAILQCPEWKEDPGTIYVYKSGIINADWNYKMLKKRL